MMFSLKGRFSLLNNRYHSGGFVLAEFAIALPLLILLGVGLANIGVKIFELGRNQLADYVLENEAQYFMERISHQARAAIEVEIEDSTYETRWIKIVYHTSETHPTEPIKGVADVRETQYFVPYDVEHFGENINAKRQQAGALTNPITGGNFFGDTKINLLKYDVDEAKKILHITLEMESLVSGHKIRLVTAIFMPDCNSVTITEGSQ